MPARRRFVEGGDIVGEDRGSTFAGRPTQGDEALPRRPDRRSERRRDLAARSLSERQSENGHRRAGEECPPSAREADDPRLAGGP